ncbi:MAG: hypothetical protein J1F02_06685, partial [Lachnospiraceae bacterium]|nr:hypothetical protein [Lachnospiraceae bacterium]
KKGEGIPMVLLSDVLNEIGYEKGHKQGLEEGIEQGIEEGTEHTRQELISNMLQDHQTPEDISRMTKQPLEYIRRVQESLLVQEKGQYDAGAIQEEKG